MSDEELRRLRRRWLESNADSDEVDYLVELVRRGLGERARRELPSDNEAARETLVALLGPFPPRVQDMERQPGLWRCQLEAPAGYCELSGPYPTQAVGSVGGTDFYFRRDDLGGGSWSFEAQDAEGRPFPKTDSRHFARKATATTLELQEAFDLILRCLAEFLASPREP